MSTQFSANVTRVLVILHVFLRSSCQFEVGGTQLEKGDVTYLSAILRLLQHLNEILMTVVGLLLMVPGRRQIKSDEVTPTQL